MGSRPVDVVRSGQQSGRKDIAFKLADDLVPGDRNEAPDVFRPYARWTPPLRFSRIGLTGDGAIVIEWRHFLARLTTWIQGRFGRESWLLFAHVPAILDGSAASPIPSVGDRARVYRLRPRIYELNKSRFFRPTIDPLPTIPSFRFYSTLRKP